MSARHGVLVAFEGIDGSGKTTQARALAASLAGDGVDVVRTREPTDGPWGSRIRRCAAAGLRLSAHEELFAFVEDRREHVRDVVAPGLRRGAVVVVDRYYFSSVAYQGARGLDPDAIRRQNESFAPRPYVLVILRADPAAALARVAARGAADAFEREDELRRAAAVYDDVRDPAPLRLDAARDAAELAAEIRRTVDAARRRVEEVERGVSTAAAPLRHALAALVVARNRHARGDLPTARVPFGAAVTSRAARLLERLGLAEVSGAGAEASAEGAEFWARTEGEGIVGGTG